MAVPYIDRCTDPYIEQDIVLRRFMEAWFPIFLIVF